MSPLMMRFFTLVGIALAAASMQMKARAAIVPGAEARPQLQATAAAQPQAVPRA